MKLAIILLVLLVIACGKSDSSNSEPKEQVAIQEQLGISIVTICRRAEDVIGMNSTYRWTIAPEEHLQKVEVDLARNEVRYQEARSGDDLHGASPYRYEDRQFFFKTLSRSLKLTFGPSTSGRILDEEDPVDYVVSSLSYDDGSGFKAYFLCTPVQPQG